MKTAVLLGLLILLSACISAPPQIAGKGAVYGIVRAAPHRLIKDDAMPESEYQQRLAIAQSERIDYDHLDEIYVCLVERTPVAPREHLLLLSEQGFSPRALAIGKGDRLRIRNQTSRDFDLFVAEVSGTEAGFQSFPPLRRGAEAVYTVSLAGDLEIGADQDPALIASIFSRDGLMSQKHSSGERYAFENLNPGDYDLILWHWRLGSVQRRVTVRAGENERVDQVLSVDKVIGRISPMP